MKKTSSFYLSTKWKKKRASILRRDGYLCRESFRYGRRVPASTVHHIFPRKEFPEYELSDWNLISLCSTVHDQLHDRNTNELTAKGRDLLRRTARKYGIEIPEKYKE